MRVDLYPAGNEVANPLDDFLKLLHQDAAYVAVDSSGSVAGRVRISGTLDRVAKRIQEWLDQAAGRMASPPSVYEQHLLGQGCNVTIVIHSITRSKAASR